jgi:hypothetical protein
MLYPPFTGGIDGKEVQKGEEKADFDWISGVDVVPKYSRLGIYVLRR